jgi:hypothetical protein
MSKFILSHSEVPPGGMFYYVQPETNCRIEGGDYDSWINAVELHRKANQIELEPLWKLHVEEWLCHNLHAQGKPWCRIQGLGDVIAYGLKPITYLADQYLGTNISSCKGCANRQQQWNK